MQITRKNTDQSTSVLNVNIAAEDYISNVEDILRKYQKSANIPGFRKGMVPIGVIKKQYKKAIVVDEVNKILQESVNKYIVEEKLDILGHPLPIPSNDIDWDSKELEFEFELGLTPEFDIDLESVGKIKYFQINASEDTVNSQIEEYSVNFGKLITQEAINSDSEIKILSSELNDDGSIKEEGIVKNIDISFKKYTDYAQSALLEKKVGEIVTIQAQNLFKDQTDLKALLGVENINDFDSTLQLTIQSINKVEKHELNQDFFDKIYGVDVISSEENLKKRMKEDIEKAYEKESKRHFFNEVVENLVKNIQIELPKEFLKKWLKSTSKHIVDNQAADLEYQRSESGIKYQLIENKIFQKYNISLTHDEVKNRAEEIIKSQLLQFGRADIDQNELNDIIGRVFQNESEYNRISSDLKTEKLTNLFVELISKEQKEVTFEEFVAEISSTKN